MGFGNDDPIDKRNRERIRVLEARNKELEIGLSECIVALANCTALNHNQRARALAKARRALYA